MTFLLNNANFVLDILKKYEINNPKRVAHFLAQTEHESKFSVKSENLNYDPIGAVKNLSLSNANALKYGRTAKQKANQQMLANIAYGNRMGNRGIDSGDGWKYRGRGFIQLTGLDNYKKFAAYSGIDVVNNPDLLLNPKNAFISACWYFRYGSSHGDLNKFADDNNIKMVSIGINGGFSNGKADRIAKTNKYLKENFLDTLKKKSSRVIPLLALTAVISLASFWAVSKVKLVKK